MGETDISLGKAIDAAASAHKRIDALEREVKDLRTLTLAIAKVDSKVDNIKEDVEEIKQEMKHLIPIFEKLEKASDEKKLLPFSAITFNLDAKQENIMIQEGFLKREGDKYYLPEIIRHALNFKYEKGARPKVLSLVFGK